MSEIEIIEDLDQFFKDRDEALLSLDKDKILAYSIKYGAYIPKDERVFWAGVHKARLALNCVDAEGKIISRNWLAENGFSAKGWE
jgi:hypothetical protein